MMNFRIKSNTKSSRVLLTDQIMKHFFANIYKGSVAKLQEQTGLAYRLIYNIVNRRVKSISSREYRLIFKEIPPVQLMQKIDGTFFRNMVVLWLFLNDRATKSDLYREVFGKNGTKRVDYRVFSGKTQTIDIMLEKTMLEKFESYGLDRKTVEDWIAELELNDYNGRVAYSQIEPILRFLEKTAAIHPSSILNQYVERYKNGKLKSVSRKVYERALELKRKIEESLKFSNKLLLEKVKEEVYGGKKGYTLYAEIEEELMFLQKFAKRSPKKYLGRSTTVYKRGGCRRITSTRSQSIRVDCQKFICQNPQLKIKSLPTIHKLKRINDVLQLLKSRITHLLFRAEGIDFEKHILAPLHSKSEYRKSKHGFTQFDLACRTLGIKKKVFDLMVATNCEIFKMVGQYENRWYLSDLYLKELAEKKYFDLITAKYEFLAEKGDFSQNDVACM